MPDTRPGAVGQNNLTTRPGSRCRLHPVPGTAGFQSPNAPAHTTLVNCIEPFRPAGCAYRVVAALFANRAILLTDGGHFAHDNILDQSQARPVVRFL